jgi:hypothetical protein
LYISVGGYIRCKIETQITRIKGQGGGDREIEEER